MNKRELMKSLVDGPLSKMPLDEPVFLLRAQDCLAAECIERWVIRARAMGVDTDKLNGAVSVADEMLNWHMRKVPD